jgi:hypothetical protein
MATPYAEAMSGIVRECSPLLKGRGFKKRRHSFNRAAPDGLVHVAHFWMAPFEPSAWTEIPGLRERRYGGFRLDFGVWVPAMDRSRLPRSEWVNEYNCNLRAPIGRLIDPSSWADFWWDLQREDAAQIAMAGLIDYGLPWLDRFISAEDILEAFEAEGSIAIGMTPAGALDIADLYASRGRSGDSRRTLEDYVAASKSRNHAEYLAKYLVERGHGDLVSQIRTHSPSDAG